MSRISYTCVFKNDASQVKTTTVDACSKVEAEAYGRNLAGKHFGDFCYARPTGQQPLEVGRLYKLKPNQGLRCIRYRAVDEQCNMPFDYVGVKESGEVVFPVISRKLVCGGLTSFSPRFQAAFSGRFADMCDQYVAKFEFKDGAMNLIFCDEVLLAPAISVPLELTQ